MSCYLLFVVWDNSLEFRYFIESLFKVSGISGTKILMLPLAYSLGTMINCIFLWYFIKKDFMQNEMFIMKSFFQNLVASFFVGVVAYLSLNIFAFMFDLSTFWGIFMQGFAAGVLGLLVGCLILALFRNNEFIDLVKTLKTKFWRNKIMPHSEESI